MPLLQSSESWGGGLPGVAFAVRTYPRLETAIAFAIQSQGHRCANLPQAENCHRVRDLVAGGIDGFAM
jgi:hypothetical protein